MEPDCPSRYCRQQLESREEAEDLTSVVFLEAWRRRNDVVFAEDSVLPWLIAVANKLDPQPAPRGVAAPAAARRPPRQLAGEQTAPVGT